jgi:hypothetical protein
MASPLMNVGPVTASEREEEPKGILPGSRKVVHVYMPSTIYSRITRQ